MIIMSEILKKIKLNSVIEVYILNYCAEPNELLKYSSNNWRKTGNLKSKILYCIIEEFESHNHFKFDERTMEI